LEEEICLEKLENRIEQLLQTNLQSTAKIDLDKSKLEIFGLVNNYYKSEIYKQISSFQNYRNEYEIYIKQKDFYLYGIIDKLIVENKTAQIIDYKTDSLKKYSAQEKLENYKYQLMFYAYLVKKINPEVETVVCKLIFIEKPDEIAEINVTSEMLNEFEAKIYSAINEMRKGIYNKNKNHCKSCYFSNKNNCVID
jgi:ATP-dependent exoDNAse (exonuclease V) beta subunit